MPANLRKSGAAQKDLLDHFLYIGRNSKPAATRFLRAVDKACQFLVDFPKIGSLWDSDNPALEGIRFWSIKKFEKYLIFYQPVSDGIYVLRIFHSAQDIENLLEE